MDGYAPCAMQSSDAFPSPTVDRVPPAVPRPGNLPAELDRFVGRSAELAALARAMERSRLVTVTGVGGIGNYFLWRAASEAAFKKVPVETAIRRAKKAESLGLTYREYQLEILERGRFLQAEDSQRIAEIIARRTRR